MKLQVKIKNLYGNDHVYPVCKNAENFCKLLKQKTLTQRDIELIKLLGYEFSVVNNEIKF